jgi:hypothetical protein
VVQQVLGHLRLESTVWYVAAAEDTEARAGLALAGRKVA